MKLYSFFHVERGVTYLMPGVSNASALMALEKWMPGEYMYTGQTLEIIPDSEKPVGMLSVNGMVCPRALHRPILVDELGIDYAQIH